MKKLRVLVVSIKYKQNNIPLEIILILIDNEELLKINVLVKLIELQKNMKVIHYKYSYFMNINRLFKLICT